MNKYYDPNEKLCVGFNFRMCNQVVSNNGEYRIIDRTKSLSTWCWFRFRLIWKLKYILESNIMQTGKIPDGIVLQNALPHFCGSRKTGVESPQLYQGWYLRTFWLFEYLERCIWCTCHTYNEEAKQKKIFFQNPDEHRPLHFPVTLSKSHCSIFTSSDLTHCFNFQLLVLSPLADELCFQGEMTYPWITYRISYYGLGALILPRCHNRMPARHWRNSTLIVFHTSRIKPTYISIGEWVVLLACRSMK